MMFVPKAPGNLGLLVCCFLVRPDKDLTHTGVILGLYRDNGKENGMEGMRSFLDHSPHAVGTNSTHSTPNFESTRL